MTFAAIDWVMSISPHWASTIYGFLFVAGQLISVDVADDRDRGAAGAHRADGRADPERATLHDLGKLLLAFVMLWAYFDFSQLLIIWSGNQPEEITFYRSRLYGGWGVVAVIVLIFHFFVPFFLLLSRDLKRNCALLPKVAIWLIFMRLVDLFWMTRPEFTAQRVAQLDGYGGAHRRWSDCGSAYFAFNLQKMPLLPLGDPNLAEAIAHHEH